MFFRDCIRHQCLSSVICDKKVGAQCTHAYVPFNTRLLDDGKADIDAKSGKDVSVIDFFRHYAPGVDSLSSTPV